MTERTVEERVIETLNEIVTLPEGADSLFVLESLKMDSLDVTEFVMELEEEFDGVTIEDSIVETWKTIGNVVDYVEGKLS